MASAAAPPPITGVPIDPPPGEVPAVAERLDRSRIGGIGYRALRRYSHAKAGLLSAGTAYYLFLSTLSLLAFAYGVVAILGADELSERLTELLGEAMPGLIGEDGVDPAQLRSTGRTVGAVGLVLLLYSGLGAVGGAAASMHLVYGAPPDPRNIVRAKARHLLLLCCVAPLVLVSLSSVSLTSSLATPVLDLLGWDSGALRAAVSGVGLLVGFAVDVLILWILLGYLGGIRPHRRPRLVASLIGAVGTLLVKQLLGVIVAWSLDKPQYGAFAAPLAILFVLSLLTTTLYVSAAVAGGISDQDVPLEDLEPTPRDAVRETPEPD